MKCVRSHHCHLVMVQSIKCEAATQKPSAKKPRWKQRRSQRERMWMETRKRICTCIKSVPNRNHADTYNLVLPLLKRERGEKKNNKTTNVRWSHENFYFLQWIALHILCVLTTTKPNDWDKWARKKMWPQESANEGGRRICERTIPT